MNLIDSLGIEKLSVNNNSFTAQISLNEFHAQPQGFLNGGVTLAFAEIASGMASLELVSENEFPVGQSISAQHLNSTFAKGILVANGELVKKGKRSHVWEIKFLDEKDTLISLVTVTNAIIERKK